jgi:hypothetical protein
MFGKAVFSFICIGALLAAPACFASQETEHSAAPERREALHQPEIQKSVDVTSSLSPQQTTQAPKRGIAEQLISATEIDRSEDQAVRLSPWFGGRGAVGVAVDVTW